MRLEFENYYDDFRDISEFSPKFALDWFYYNSKNDKTLEKRNKYRERIGFSKVLDNGAYCYFRIYFGKRVFGLYLIIREMKLDESSQDQGKINELIKALK